MLLLLILWCPKGRAGPPRHRLDEIVLFEYEGVWEVGAADAVPLSVLAEVLLDETSRFPEGASNPQLLPAASCSIRFLN
jgi:hypothetical protein